MAYLEARGLGRDFPGVTALDDVDIDISSGRTHVLVGENGAGKSTFVKMVTGTDRPSRGTIRIDGKDAHDHPELFRYVAYVPQELNLFPHMSVAENLLMPFARSGHHGIVRRRALEAEAQTYLDRFGIEARPSDLVRNISVPDQQLLQIARASTNKDMKVLILDEPTSSLTPIEVERVFRVIRDFHDRGVAVVFISHKMDEVFDIGHDYTVLRNGRKIEAGKLSEVNEEALIRAMSGQKLELGTVFRPESERGAALLEVDGLSGPRFDDVSFTLDAGEILGFAGLVGAGRTEAFEAILGLRPRSAGTIEIDGQPAIIRNPRDAMRLGLTYLSEDRKGKGLHVDLGLRENLTMMTLERDARPWLDIKGGRAALDKAIADFGIRLRDPDCAARSL